jgi:hypothetical protein
VRKRLFGILVPVILGLSLGIPSASASTVRAANPARTTHSSGVRIAATPQFLAALQKARRAGRGVRSDDPTGICWSGSSLCWRDMPTGAIDLWNRDISGDARQQWTVIYEGTANQVGCPYPEITVYTHSATAVDNTPAPLLTTDTITSATAPPTITGIGARAAV